MSSRVTLSRVIQIDSPERVDALRSMMFWPRSPSVSSNFYSPEQGLIPSVSSFNAPSTISPGLSASAYLSSLLPDHSRVRRILLEYRQSIALFPSLNHVRARGRLSRDPRANAAIHHLWRRGSPDIEVTIEDHLVDLRRSRAG